METDVSLLFGRIDIILVREMDLSGISISLRNPQLILTDRRRRPFAGVSRQLRPPNFSRSETMVYIISWDDFVERSVQLFRSNPQKTRYVMKYRHSEGKLVLKVTDDRECLKFKTDQAQDAKKMEKLNNIFFTLMARGPEGITPSSSSFSEFSIASSVYGVLFWRVSRMLFRTISSRREIKQENHGHNV
ncbi:hypothetical protein OSB04_023021 [Centaurea solstitialis]|uniref:Signal recognition particle 9 kDa protein n=1 Tax=Centaurea solstitialis TaxID=347529 RepID=A0AA38SIA5_9ASTR|nr:hypothetical protein OSB04_023021 [Centaurea solstitialis]